MLQFVAALWSSSIQLWRKGSAIALRGQSSSVRPGRLANREREREVSYVLTAKEVQHSGRLQNTESSFLFSDFVPFVINVKPKEMGFAW